MRLENTKWGARIVSKNGFYIEWAWKAWLLAMGIGLTLIGALLLFR